MIIDDFMIGTKAKKIAEIKKDQKKNKKTQKKNKKEKKNG